MPREYIRENDPMFRRRLKPLDMGGQQSKRTYPLTLSNLMGGNRRDYGLAGAGDIREWITRHVQNYGDIPHDADLARVYDRALRFYANPRNKGKIFRYRA